MLSPTEENVKWERLLEWLAGHGMSVDGEGLLVERRQQHSQSEQAFPSDVLDISIQMLATVSLP